MKSPVRLPTSSCRALAGPLALGLGLLVDAAPLGADGFGIYTHGARASGMGGAWAARVMDPSAIFYNVAGMTQLEGTQLYGGTTVIVNSGNGVSLFDGREFDQVGKTFVLPHLYLTHALNERLAVGVGLFEPYGLATEWDPANFPGRFRSFDADLKSIYVQPSVAYALTPTFSVGAGVDLVYADVELNRQSDLSTLVLSPAGTTFGQVTGLPPNTVGFLESELAANGTGLGFNVGVLFKATPAVQLALNYRSQVTVEFEGDAEFRQLPTNIILGVGNPLGALPGTPLDVVLQPRLPVNQDASTELVFPDQLIGGISVTPAERWMVNFDVKWTNWKDFDRVVIDFEEENPENELFEPNYDNGTSFRVGTEYFVTPAVALRGGYIRDENPSPEAFVNPLLPDADRNEFSVGLGWSTGPWQIDAYGLVELFEERAGVVGAEDDIPDGEYETTAYIFGVDFGYRF